MGKIVAYLRASTNKQDLSHQKLEILEFARSKQLDISDFIEVTISSRKTSKQRRIDELLELLHGVLDICPENVPIGQTLNENAFFA